MSPTHLPLGFVNKSTKWIYNFYKLKIDILRAVSNYSVEFKLYTMKHLAPNLEALRLYRDVLRLARLFTWRNERHELLRDVLMGNARKEFEQARYERDPLIVARLLFVGRDCLNQTRERLAGKYQKVKDEVDKSRTS